MELFKNVGGQLLKALATMVTTSGSTFTGRWNGDSQIVVGIGVGTTCSGVAYTFLQKGAEQQLYRVDTWPGQHFSNSSGKIPTLVYYDLNGRAVAFGAEAVTRKTEREAKIHKWKLAKEFKLHLHPANLQREHNLELHGLPNGVPLKTIYSDFLGYLIKHTKSRFEVMIADGEKISENYHPKMTVVIAHPNGWGIAEQSFLRDAAVTAGLSPLDDAATRIRFVSEAEASVHFCMHYTNLRSSLETDTKFAVCDAGGSTVDTTLYNVHEKEPHLRLGELRGSACVQAGAIYVNEEAEKHLRRIFETPNAGLTNKEIKEFVSRGIEDFEGLAKRQFGSGVDDEEISVKFAGDDFENEDLGVMFGELSLPSAEIKKFFDPCVNKILESVRSLVSSTQIKYIALVGGFGDNAFLQSRLKNQFKPTECQIVTTGQTASKAVADGAVIWHAANNVFKRVPRFSYGTDYVTTFDPTNPEHRGRRTFQSPHGTCVGGAWATIVSKDIPLDCDAVHRHSFSRVYPPIPIPPYWLTMSDEIYACSSAGSPNWMTDATGKLHDEFQQICTINTKVSDMLGALVFAQERRSGNAIWFLQYDICMRFGRTEPEAYVEWEEEGVTRTGPAIIVPTLSAGRD